MTDSSVNKMGSMQQPSRLALRPSAVLDVVSGETLRDHAVLIDDGLIVDVVPTVALPGDVPVHELPGMTLLPGLIDTHAHLIGEVDDGHGYASLLTSSSAREVMIGARNARDTLEAGFTSVRDVGTFRAFADVALRDAIDAGWVRGPRMQPAGAYVTAPGGGGDIAGLAPDVDAVVPLELRYGVVRNVDDVRRVVRQVIQGGAGVVKVIATGSVMSSGGIPGAPELTEEQIAAAVEEASYHGVHVAAHAHGAEGAKRAIRAGVRSIEHGSLLDDEAIDLMVAHGTYLSADIYGGDYIAETGAREGWDATVLAGNDETTLTQRLAFRECVRRGVPIAFGTDSGIYPHGWNARQLAYHVQWGQSPLEAIRSATMVSARLMGWDGQVGALVPGAHADVIAVAGDPLQDVRLLEDVRWVMKGGVIEVDRIGTA
jgi:imidazolonepropionase-like amidohydrolase